LLMQRIKKSSLVYRNIPDAYNCPCFYSCM